MSRKRIIQLRGLKDKTSKRYFVNIRFYHKNVFLFQARYDINDLVTQNNWTNISSGETIEIFKYLFDIYTGKYPLPSKDDDRSKFDFWSVKEEDGFSICLKDEDLAKLRDKKIEDLGL